MNPSDPARHLLRHTVATLAYRGAKTLRGAPDAFADFRAPQDTRTPGQILAHIGDVLDWASSVARGQEQWQDSKLLPWPQEVLRFFSALESFDALLASETPLHVSPEKLFQGPIADTLTHVGQLAMLRRLAGAPLRGENYYVATIAVGSVGADQPAPVREFS